MDKQKTRGRINDIDRIVSKNLKFYRTKSGQSQKALANSIGVTFQQIQKYENGKNRISAGNLYKIAQCLGVTPNDFHCGLEFSGIGE